MDFSNILHILDLLSGNIGVSMMIFFLTLLFSLPLGLAIAFGRMAKNKIISGIIRIYISIMRGTPLMLQLFVVYFIPFYGFGISLSKLGDYWLEISVVLAFVLNYAAYFAEIYRSGIESMPKGQYEAAKVLGMNRFETFFIIILPQVIRRILPALTGEVVTLVKDTSLSFAIGLVEMFTKAKQIAADQTSLLPLFIAGILYYIFNYAVVLIAERLEKRLGKYEIR